MNNIHVESKRPGAVLAPERTTYDLEKAIVVPMFA